MIQPCYTQCVQGRGIAKSRYSPIEMKSSQSVGIAVINDHAITV
jgi:hypothetical protein